MDLTVALSDGGSDLITHSDPLWIWISCLTKESFVMSLTLSWTNCHAASPCDVPADVTMKEIELVHPLDEDL